MLRRELAGLTPAFLGGRYDSSITKNAAYCFCAGSVCNLRQYRPSNFVRCLSRRQSSAHAYDALLHQRINSWYARLTGILAVAFNSSLLFVT